MEIDEEHTLESGHLILNIRVRLGVEDESLISYSIYIGHSPTEFKHGKSSGCGFRWPRSGLE